MFQNSDSNNRQDRIPALRLLHGFKRLRDGAFPLSLKRNGLLVCLAEVSIATFGHFGEADMAADALRRLRDLKPDFDEVYVRETYPYAKYEDLAIFMDGLRAAKAI